jgi:hypothetical protein
MNLLLNMVYGNAKLRILIFYIPHLVTTVRGVCPKARPGLAAVKVGDGHICQSSNNHFRNKVPEAEGAPTIRRCLLGEKKVAS